MAESVPIYDGNCHMVTLEKSSEGASESGSGKSSLFACGWQKLARFCQLGYDEVMSRGAQAEQATKRVLALRRVTPASQEDRALLDLVVDDLRRDAGEWLTKSSAARILGVSRNTLDKWVSRGVIPTRDRGVDRAGLEEIAVELDGLRASGEDRALLAEALYRLEQEDPQWQKKIAEIIPERSPDDELVSAAPGRDWNPGD